jgi:HEAT repeat protein
MDRRMIITAAVAGLSCLTAGALRAEGTVDYQVRTHMVGLKGGDAKTAAERLGDIGPPARAAVPALRELAAGKMPPRVRWRPDDVEITVASAHYALAMITGKAEPHVSALAGVVKAGRDRPSRKAADLLEKMGPRAEAAVGVLTEALKVPNFHAVSGAVRALGAIGPGAKPAVPALRGIAAGRGPLRGWSKHLVGGVVLQAHCALARITGQAKPHVDVLARALEGTGQTPFLAAGLLGKMGSKAKAAVPALTAAAKKPNGFAALGALGKIGPDAAPAVPALIELAKSGSQFQRAAAVQALGEIGPAAKQAVPVLAGALEHPLLRAAAAEALAGMGTAARPALPRLKAMLKQASSGQPIPQVAVAACIKALGAIGRPAETVPMLLQALERPQYKADVCRALVAIGKPAVDILAREATSKDSKRRQRAYGALQGMGKLAVPVYVRLLGQRDPWARAGAVQALGNIGPDAKEAVPALRKAARDKRLAPLVKEALQKITAKPPR